MIIKVCGMSSGENIRHVEKLGADMIGLIFYPRSPRYVYSTPDYLPLQAKRVGVFVNEHPEAILEKVTAYGLNYIQLHGDESPEACLRINNKGLGVIKAFRINESSDIKALTLPYDGICNYFLFDTASDSYGGSGKAFSWDILDKYSGNTPFLLSGGIGPEDIDKISSFAHPQCAGIDLNSRFEISPGIKDEEQLHEFINKIKSIRQ